VYAIPIYDSHFPKFTIRANKNKHTPELLTARQTKLQLHKLYLTAPTPENRAIYKQLRKEYNTAIRRQKAQYY
jgi:hypothetical protein